MLIAAEVALKRHLRRAGDAIDILYTLIAYPQGTATALAVASSGWRGRFLVMPGGEDLLVAPEASFGFRRFAIPRWLIRRTLRRADGICCQSSAIREIVLRHRPRGVVREFTDNVAADVVALADESPARRRLRRETARRRIDEQFGPSDRPLAVALGRLHPVKGFDRLIDLLPKLPHRLVIAGPSLALRGRGDVAASLEARARELGVRDRVLLTGRVPQQQSYELLAAADVLAVPSHREGMPKVAVEAAALGTPFILTSTCGLAAHVGVDAIGKIVPHWDPAACAAELVAAVSMRPDPEQARRFVHRFSPDSVASSIQGMLDAISTQ
jgi:glycosyltransferase involved in cell wall biosynthesis